METYKKHVKEWQAAFASHTEEERQELEKLAKDPTQVQDSFYRFLEFGTAGMRGILGLGTNRMNTYTVRRATQGFAQYLLQSGHADGGVAIAYDSRQNSDVFAKEAALILAANRIKTFLYSTLHSVPQLSYTVLKLHCAGGIVITASHNPPEYNGYKVYGPDGGQLGTEDALHVTNCINAVKNYLALQPMSEQAALDTGLLTYIGPEIDAQYYKDVLSLVIDKEAVAEQAPALKVIYTPLFGSGNKPVTHLLRSMGVNISVLEAQAEPDPTFPGISAPNPENKEAFTLANREASREKADFVIATDPDCDRLGVAVKDENKEYTLLSGNQIGCILMDYILRMRKPQFTGGEFVVESIVSTPLADSIAQEYGVEMRHVLTGFKYIAEQINLSLTSGKGKFVFGFEESFGYLGGTFVRDKDAAMAAVLLSEAACSYKKQGLSLYGALNALYKKHGYYAEKVLSLTLSGMHGDEKIRRAVDSLRSDKPQSIIDSPVTAVSDFLTGIRETTAGETSLLTLPKTNMLLFEFPNGRIIFRPSGTEPKLKAYITYVASDREKGEETVETLFNWAIDDLRLRTM